MGFSSYFCRTPDAFNLLKKFAQNLHRFRGEIDFAQFLHKLNICTKIAQVFPPEVAAICNKTLANKRNYLILYGQ
jgi:hypothetical protein